MKVLFRSISLSVLLLLASSVACFSQDYKGSFRVHQTLFSEANDSLHIGLDLEFDSYVVGSCTSMIFEPVLTDGSHEICLPFIQVNGKTRSKLNRRWFSLSSRKWLSSYKSPYMLVDVNKYTNDRLSYRFDVPYEAWMDSCRLELRQEIIDCGAETHLYSYILGGDIDRAIRAPYEVQALTCLAIPIDEVKSRNRQGSAFLDFQTGRSVILPDFRRNPIELGKINDALTDVMSDMDSQITGLFIEGYASPEGRYTSNDKLARDRAVALKDYIKNRYMLSDNLFTVKSVAEDWDGLKSLVERNDIPQKDRVLAIINSGADFDVREQQLKSLSVYSQLLRDFFPELRRVEYQIDYAVRNYSTSEARSLINSSPENLSQAELYRLALEYGEGTLEYRRIIMEVIPKYYGNDAVALSNAAALMINNGEYNTAARLLERAQSVPAAWNNLGVVYLHQDNLDKAEELFRQASVAGIKEADHNLSELKMKREDNEQRAKRGK